MGSWLGVSAISLASAELFRVLSSRHAYLIWLGVRTFRRTTTSRSNSSSGLYAACARKGVLVEALNPKTGAFFLALIPRFVDPAGSYVALQFITLGLISVALDTLADVVVVMMAGQRARVWRAGRICFNDWTRPGAVHRRSGISLALARRPAA